MPRPYDWRFEIEIPYDTAEEEALSRQMEVRVRRNDPGLLDRISEFFNQLWSAFKWALTLGGNITETGDEQQEFDAGDAVKNDERLLAALEIDPQLKFFENCMRSRGQKKLILLVVMTNPEDES